MINPTTCQEDDRHPYFELPNSSHSYATSIYSQTCLSHFSSIPLNQQDTLSKIDDVFSSKFLDLNSQLSYLI